METQTMEPNMPTRAAEEKAQMSQHPTQEDYCPCGDYHKGACKAEITTHKQFQRATGVIGCKKEDVNAVGVCGNCGYMDATPAQTSQRGEKMHTSGAWKVETWKYPNATPPREELVIQNDHFRLAVVECDFTGKNPYTIPQQEAEANARLIASAPAMLEALEYFMEMGADDPDSLLRIQAAINLARGEG